MILGSEKTIDFRWSKLYIVCNAADSFFYLQPDAGIGFQAARVTGNSDAKGKLRATIERILSSERIVIMNRPKLSAQLVGIILIALLFVGCGTPAAISTPNPPTLTQTVIPSTSTHTPVPPTDTPTAVPPTRTATPTFTLATSIADIAGVWHNSRKGLYFRFNEVGTLEQANSPGGLDFPFAVLDIWFEGTQMYLKEKEVYGVPSCGDEPAVYEVWLYQDSTIQIKTIKDSCIPRAGDTALKLTRVP